MHKKLERRTRGKERKAFKERARWQKGRQIRHKAGDLVEIAITSYNSYTALHFQRVVYLLVSVGIITGDRKGTL